MLKKNKVDFPGSRDFFWGCHNSCTSKITTENEVGSALACKLAPIASKLGTYIEQ
ncbi:hypothetical protein M408DRAFT_328362 [Serendipita vermifera MAFF 305830]|uniref:Uncharacterized protein n=1 Tax=Serendipita vermifera MAFF 305830 TaxID=933852 RepID=A0A0C2WW20_SERVB|nr:hypothetical protein M408DRAFT_328362 [Serendipita vermifera MAFF 305830]